jgi:hypothetical protein
MRLKKSAQEKTKRSDKDGFKKSAQEKAKKVRLG